MVRQSPLTIMGTKFTIDPAKLIVVLRNTVIKATDKYTPTDEEVAAFVMVANEYDLNPFTREIHAFADPRKGVVPIVGIDGWARIVNRQERYDGNGFEYVLDAAGKPVSTTCTMFVKGRSRPTMVTEYFAECVRPTDPWSRHPRRMLRHKAFIQCARIAFSIAGIYDEDEAKDIVAGPYVEQSPKTTLAESVNAAKSITRETVNTTTGEVGDAQDTDLSAAEKAAAIAQEKADAAREAAK